MEGASSAIKKLESDFDAVFGPNELESERPLWFSANECTNPICKPRKLGPRGRAFRFSGEWILVFYELSSARTVES